MNKYSFNFEALRTKDAAKTEQIYKATLHLVKERGLAGITMNDISKEASIATGTLYIYFKSKDELIKALFTECRTVSAQHYFEGVNDLPSLEKKLKRLFTNIIHYKIAFFEVSAFLEQSYHSPFVCATDLKKKQIALKPLFDLVKEGIGSGRLKPVGEELIISYLFGIIHEMVKKTYFAGKKLSPETIEKLYSMFWDGVRQR